MREKISLIEGSVVGDESLPTFHLQLGGKGEGMRGVGVGERKAHVRAFLFSKFGEKNIF